MDQLLLPQCTGSSVIKNHLRFAVYSIQFILDHKHNVKLPTVIVFQTPNQPQEEPVLTQPQFLHTSINLLVVQYQWI